MKTGAFKHQGRLTELVLLLKVHVNDTARPDINHVLAIESLDLGELTGTRSVAAVFSEEDGNVVLLEVLGLDVIAGLGEGRVTAPGVNIVTPEVDSAVFVTAVKVVGHVLANLGIVVGCVSNTDLTVVLALDVGLGVTDSSLDESTGNGVVGLVADLIAGEEAKGVIILHHLIDDTSVAVVEINSPTGIVSVDGETRLGQVGNDIDASICELGHAVRVILLGVNGVNTNGVGVELLEHGDITLACSRIGEGIGDVEVIRRRRRGVGADFLC
jgi:hypothetical protein